MKTRRIGRRAVELVFSIILLFLLFSRHVNADIDITVYYGTDYSAVYDYYFYIEANPDVAAYYGSGSERDKRSALEHFVRCGMRERRIASKDFDVNSYMNRYVDLRNTYGTEYQKYYLHYINYGKREGRISTGCDERLGSVTFYEGVDYSKVFDADFYLKKYADLRAAFGNDDILALRHFVKCGMREGRQASNNFDVISYRLAYQDLRLAFGNDLTKYYLHYIRYGSREGRVACGVDRIINPISIMNGTDYSAVYDFTEYQKRNVDVKAAFGEDDIATLIHFIAYGMRERRIANDSFDISVYSNSYSDLQLVYNDSFKDYYLHYINYGNKEGRKSSSDTGETQVAAKIRSVYRLYNRYSGEHFYTSDKSERDNLVRIGWSDEGAVWDYKDGMGVPVYRLVKPGSGHRYTQHKDEYNEMLKTGWISEGIAFYVNTDKKTNYYTLINTGTTSEYMKYLYTSDSSEIAFLEKLGWIKMYGIHSKVDNRYIYEKKNKRSVDRYLGGNRDLIDYLTANQKSYLGKPYIDEYSSDFYIENSISSGIQCASFVSIVMQSIGCDTDIIINETGGSPYWASTWISFAKRHHEIGDIDVYVYDSIEELISDGKAKKGDVILFDSTGPLGYYDQYGNIYDNHMGFFWGDEVIYDKMWHSACATTGLGRQGYTILYDGTNPGNQITNVTPVSSGNVIYLLPVSQH